MESDYDVRSSKIGVESTMKNVITLSEKAADRIKEIINDFLEMIKVNPELNSKNLKEDEKTKLMSLSGVKQYPMRVKCATLSWHTLTSAMNNTQEEINTEKFD